VKAIYFDDGRIHGYVFVREDGRWHKGAYGADIAYKASGLSKTASTPIFPDVELPPSIG
jgi:hypothetical protein